MISRFPDGHTPPRNRQAALLHGGGHTAIGRRQGGTVSAFAGAARPPAHTGRPGPQPTSTRRATAALRWNDETKWVKNQLLREVQARAFQRDFARAEAEWSDGALHRQMEELGFPAYDPRRGHTYDTQLVDRGHSPTGYYGYQLGELWVYIRARGDLHVLEYAVVNPKTGHLLTFTPEAAVAATRQVYQPEDATVRNLAAGTGQVGRYMEYGTYGLAAGAFVLPYAAAAAIAASETAVGGVVITAFRSVGTKIAEQFTWSTFRTKVGSDFAVQLVGGLVKNQGDSFKSLSEVNITSLLTAWLLPASGWGGSLRNATIKSTVGVNVKFDRRTPPRLELKLPHLNSLEGFGNYLNAIGLDTVGDRFKSLVIKGFASTWARSMGSFRQSGTAVGQWVAANRLTLGTFGQIGVSTGVKVAKEREKEHMAQRPKSTSPGVGHNPPHP